MTIDILCNSYSVKRQRTIQAIGVKMTWRLLAVFGIGNWWPGRWPDTPIDYITAPFPEMTRTDTMCIIVPFPTEEWHCIDAIPDRYLDTINIHWWLFIVVLYCDPWLVMTIRTYSIILTMVGRNDWFCIWLIQAVSIYSVLWTISPSDDDDIQLYYVWHLIVIDSRTSEPVLKLSTVTIVLTYWHHCQPKWLDNDIIVQPVDGWLPRYVTFNEDHYYY